MRSHGYRRGSRQILRQKHRKHGNPGTSVYLEEYQVGERVTIIINPAFNKSMPHKFYHGKVGIVYDIGPTSLRIVLHKRVNGRYRLKYLVVRREHIKKSRSCEQTEKINMINEERKAEAEAKGVAYVPYKILPAGPRKEFTISLDNNEPVEVGYEPRIEVY